MSEVVATERSQGCEASRRRLETSALSKPRSSAGIWQNTEYSLAPNCLSLVWRTTRIGRVDEKVFGQQAITNKLTRGRQLFF
jgi:hypothetical protein